MIDRPILRGPQDPRLEVGRSRNWRDGVTPTTKKDIGVPAQVYIRLVETAVTHTMALEGLRGDTSSPFFQQQQEALATVRDEVRAFGFDAEGFRLVTEDRIKRLKADEKAEADDARALVEVRRQLTQTDADLQARLGDVPANVNWGNHAKRA